MPPLSFDPADFDGVDWSGVDKAIVEGQVKLLDTLSDDELRELTAAVDGLEADAARKDRILGYVAFLAKIGLRLVGV